MFLMLCLTLWSDIHVPLLMLGWECALVLTTHMRSQPDESLFVSGAVLDYALVSWHHWCVIG